MFATHSTVSLHHTNLNSFETTKSLSSLSQLSYSSFITTPDISYEVVNSTPEYADDTLKKQIEKSNVLKEILSSEKKYVNDIKEIVEGYYGEISSFHKDNQEFVYHIFSNIKEIYEFTRSFYSMLEVASAKDEIAVASCFIRKHKTFLKLYSTYCQNYKIAYTTTEKLEKDETIGKIIQKVRNKYGHCLKMATYLQLPVLRITKYHLLLQRYLKLQDKNSFAFDQVLEALELMREVNNQINREMPEINSTCYNSNLSTQQLSVLFGTVLKQGNLILTETSCTHYVIVFQTMFLIRKSDSTSTISNTIPNGHLGFSPVTIKSGNKHWKKCFSVIDYNQSKSEHICQFTFKTKSSEEKQEWQSAIISCMLNGYGKKISENIKKKVMKIDHEKYSPKYETIRMKLSSFKRLKDFRYSLKNEMKKSKSQTMEEQKKEHIIEPPSSVPINIFLNKRRLSEPYQSPLIQHLDTKNHDKCLDKHQSYHSIPYMFKKFYKKEKLKKKLNFEENLQSDSLNETHETTGNNNDNNHPLDLSKLDNNTSIEIKLNDFEIIYNNLDVTFEAIKNPLDESTVLNFGKFLNQKIATSKNNNDSTTLLTSSYIEKINKPMNIYNSSLSSKSSINSEEGYYSNHDSSVSTVINEANLDNDSLNMDKLSQPSFKSYQTHDSFEITKNNIIHIEIINNSESLPATEFNLAKPQNQIENVDILKLENNQIIINNGNYDLPALNNMQKFRYKKKSANFCKRRNLSDLKLNSLGNYYEANNNKPAIISDVKLNNNLNYTKFSRNLNRSSLSLCDDTDNSNEEQTLNLAQADSSDSNSLNQIQHNEIDQLNNTIPYADKCKSHSSLIVLNSNGQSTSARRLNKSLVVESNFEHKLENADKKINVKDLISKFETRREYF